MTRTLIVVRSLVLAACSEGDAKQGKDAKAAPALGVTIIEVALRDVPVAFEAVGRTEGSREVQVRARVSGILEQQKFHGRRRGQGRRDAVRDRARAVRDRARAGARHAGGGVGARGARAAGARAPEGPRRPSAPSARRKPTRRRPPLQQSAARRAGGAGARCARPSSTSPTPHVTAPIDGVTGRALQSIGSLVVAERRVGAADDAHAHRPDLGALRAVRGRNSRGCAREGEGASQVRLELADGTPVSRAGKLNFSGSTVDAHTGTVQMRAELPNPRLAAPARAVRARAGHRRHAAGDRRAAERGAAERGRALRLGGGAEGKAAQRPIRAGSWVGQRTGWCSKA